MNTSLHDEIDQHLSSYLGGQIDLAEFHNWFIPAAWDVDAEPERVRRMVSRIQLHLAEFSNGDMDETDLQSALWDTLGRPSVTVTIGTLPIASETINTTTHVAGTGMAMQSVGTLHAAALA